jgi:uncharacterized repeat protein (TIGR03803 family)
MKKIYVIFQIGLLGFLSLSVTAQQFWGLTELGGTSDLGTIFRTDSGGANLSVRYSFVATTPGATPMGNMIQASNGFLYGVTRAGEATESGILFRYDPATAIYSRLFTFTGSTSGAFPNGSLVQAVNGKLYGLTSAGGANGLGALFEFDIASSVFTKKIDFSGASNGATPNGSLVQAKDGKLYGMASSGGTNNMGTLFSFDPATGNLTVLLNFSGVSNGSAPNGSLIQTSSGKLCGLTYTGGTNNLGVMFSFDPATSLFSKMVDFAGATNGANPNGDLLQTSTGKLYGTTTGGGTNGSGVIFEYDTLTGLFTNRLNFDGTTQGGSPYGSLIQSSNGSLYGLTNLGGANSSGVIFKFDTVTAVLSNVTDFIGANGSNPNGSLLQALNGKLYGMTSAGGFNGNGVLFEYDPLATPAFSVKLHFNQADAGANPTASLIQASNGKLYGLTSAGGANGIGTLFEYDTVTSTYTKLVDFDGAGKGFSPKGSLVQASNGKLYGMANSGGANDKGVLFQYDPSTAVFTKELDFDAIPSGAFPYGSLIQAKNGKLYGLTYGGGTSDNGVLFEFDPGTNTFTKKMDFNGVVNGSAPYNALMQASSGKLFGLTLNGGTDTSGVLFEYDVNTSTYTKKYDFNRLAKGCYPNGGLVEGKNGLLYGMTTLGGTNGTGVIFQFDTASSVYSVSYNFNAASDGISPQSSLVMASDHKLYGLATNGGALGNGTLFGFDPTSGSYSVKDDFNTTVTGGFPYGDLLFICNQLVITSQPADTSKCQGSATLLRTSAVGTALTYQWYKNGVPLGGANGKTYSIPALALADSGFYYCSVSNSCGNQNSATEKLSVNPVPATPIITQGGAVLTSSATNNNQWYLNGALITGATSQNYTPVQNGNYSVVVTNQYFCSSSSAPFNMMNTGILASAGISLQSVYPNPATTALNVILSVAHETMATAIILDLLGNQVLKSEIQVNQQTKVQFDISNLSSGMYVLRISTADGLSLSKFNKL